MQIASQLLSPSHVFRHPGEHMLSVGTSVGASDIIYTGAGVTDVESQIAPAQLQHSDVGRRTLETKRSGKRQTVQSYASVTREALRRTRHNMCRCPNPYHRHRDPRKTCRFETPAQLWVGTDCSDCGTRENVDFTGHSQLTDRIIEADEQRHCPKVSSHLHQKASRYGR